MRYTASEKQEIIDIVSKSQLGVRRTLEELNVSKTNFYRWYSDYQENGYDGLLPKKSNRKQFWNRIPKDEMVAIVEFALENESLSSREVAVR